MATITPHLRRGKAKGGRAPIYIRISHKGKECFVSLGLQAREKDWNAPRARLRKSYTGFLEANRLIEEGATRMEAIARTLVLSGEAFSAQDIKRHYLGQVAHGDAESVDGGFLAFAWRRHALIERFNTKRNHKTALLAFSGFLRDGVGEDAWNACLAIPIMVHYAVQGA